MGGAHVGFGAPLSYVDSLEAADRDYRPRLATGAPVYQPLVMPCYAHENLGVRIGALEMGRIRSRFGHVMRDRSGKAPVKLVLGTSAIAICCAMASPAFKANPLFGRMKGVVGGDMQNVLPETLEKVTAALKAS
jgi:hypothetical protein